MTKETDAIARISARNRLKDWLSLLTAFKILINTNIGRVHGN